MSISRPFVVGGTVQAADGIYLSRQADEDLLALCRGGAFAYVLSSRQVGKSSLMVHTADQLSKDGIRWVIVDLTEIGSQLTADEWYLGFLMIVADRLGITLDMITWWNKRVELGNAQRLTLFFQEVLLPNCADRIVIFVDEIDTTLSLTFTDDFFAAIRYFYNARATMPDLRRLSFVLIGVATPGDLVQDVHRTPFNIGRSVELHDFSFDEALPFAEALELETPHCQQVLGWILKWTGGHPYLTQRVCEAVRDREREVWTEAEIDQTVTDLFLTSEARQDSNLRFVRDMLTQRAPDVVAALNTYRRILFSKIPEPDEERSPVKAHLKLAGIVISDGGILKVRNEIYSKIFNSEWVDDQLPSDKSRRLKRAVVVLSSVLLVLIGVVGVLLFNEHRNNQRRSQQSLASKLAERAEADYVRSAALLPRSQLLAIESSKLVPSFRASQTLHTGLSVLPHPFADVKLPPDTQSYFLFLDNPPAVSVKSQDNVFHLITLSDDKVITTLTAGTDSSWVESADSSKKIVMFDGNKARLFSVPSGKEQPPITVGDTITAGDISRNERYIAIGSLDYKITVWEISSGRKTAEMRAGNEVDTLSFGNTDRFLAGISRDRHVHIWEPNSQRSLADLTFTDYPRAVWGPNDSLIAIGAGSTITVWDVGLRKEVAKLPGGSSVIAVSPNSDGRRIAAATSDDVVRIWDWRAAQVVATLHHNGPLTSVGWYGGYLISEGTDVTRIWDASTYQELARLAEGGKSTGFSFYPPVHQSLYGNVAFGNHARIGEWEVTGGRREGAPMASKGDVTSIAYSPDGAYMAAGSKDSTAVLWNVATGNAFQTVRTDSEVKSVAFSPDGSHLATGGSDNAVRIWDVQTGTETAHFKYSDAVNSVAYSFDGRYVAGGSSNQALCVWNVLANRDVICRPQGAEVMTVAFFPYENSVASGGADGRVTISDLGASDKEGNFTTVIRERHLPSAFEIAKAVTALSISPDGNLIAVGSSNGAVRVWDIQQTKWSSLAYRHADAVSGLAFSKSGLYLASSGLDHTVRVWEINGGRELANIIFDAKVNGIAFSPDDHLLGIASSDHTARQSLWQVDDFISESCKRLTRNLSLDEWQEFMGTLEYHKTCPQLP